MEKITLYLLYFFLFTNVSAFLLMFIDKSKADKDSGNRISEGMLFFMATVFGSIGVYMGMFIFRHKIRKWYFIIGIPLIALQNIAFLFCLYIFLG
ncbi:MAG: DUF1294 domain-containing protein [Patescibacteria group bacterium]